MKGALRFIIVTRNGWTLGKQPELENHVGVGGYGYPAFIPLNIKNGAYALLKRDTFTDGSVKCTMTSMTASEPVVSLPVTIFLKIGKPVCIPKPTLEADSAIAEEILWDKKYYISQPLQRCFAYFQLLKFHSGTQKPVLAGPITKNITLENSDLLELSDTSSVVLAKIAGNWGETVFVDEDADENIANGRERQGGGNDQDIHSINESQEEGEIMNKKEQMGSEMNRSW
ncbi:hypothetical protein Tco_0385007 [Tanacetum coccineum]